jgi:pimeloyl-ACP methyl ester carboxylesterase
MKSWGWLGLLLIGWCGCASAAATDLPRRAGAAPETYPGVDVVYDAVANPAGQRQRLILTRPSNAAGPLPAVFIAGWLSCDSVEAPSGTMDATALLFQALAAMPGFVTVRLDKPGVGDSEGSCAETDFDAELAGYRAAFRSLGRYGFIDPQRIFVLGISNGGGFAPLVAEGAPVRGYLVDGGWLKTWYEHMLEIERRRLGLSGKSPAEVNRLMPEVARLYTAWLVDGRSPAAIFAQHPELRALWPGEDERHLYGRPLAYYQQLQQLNLAAAWSQVKVPLLALHGQYDWIMSADDDGLRVALVNRNTAGAARAQELPATGHTFEHYDSLQQAYAGKAGPFDPAIARLVVDWFEQRR